MSKARDLADFQGSASALTTGTLPVDRVPYVGRRNILINGDFDVWQRGTSGASAGYFYMADRWMSYGYAGANTTYSRQAFTLGQTEVSGSPKYFARSTNTNGVDGRPYFEQRIEDISKLSGQTVTVSFWVKSPDYSSSVYISFYRYYDGSSPEGSGDFAIGTVSDTWQKIEYTYTIPNLAGKTIGASSYLGFSITTNLPAVCSLDIAQAQLELGSVATPFEHRSYGEELALCQRYYFKSGGYVNYCCFNYNNRAYACVPLPVTMRTAPSTTDTSGGTWYQGGTSYGYTTVMSAGEKDFVRMEGNIGGGLNGGAGTFYPSFTADAEL